MTTVDFAKHEVYDRAAMVNSIWEDFVVEHPVVENDQELHSLAEFAADAISNFYARAAEKLIEAN